MEAECLLLALSLKADTEDVPENLLIGFICKAIIIIIIILRISLLQQNCKAFISTCQRRVSCAQTICVMERQLYSATHTRVKHVLSLSLSLSLLKESKTKSRSRLIDGHLKSITTRFPKISHREEKAYFG